MGGTRKGIVVEQEMDYQLSFVYVVFLCGLCMLGVKCCQNPLILFEKKNTDKQLVGNPRYENCELGNQVRGLPRNYFRSEIGELFCGKYS